jgi:hypothetical protein
MQTEFFGKCEGKRPLRTPRHRWEDSIKIDLREMGLEDMDWINLTQDRDWWWACVNIVTNLCVP